jgi:monoamine oxidase
MAGITAGSAAAITARAFPTAPDVVVIGAGAAGIAAARALIAAGKSVIMIEAADRIGGRAFTESATFGQPYDLGCSWLQGPDNLPHLSLARARGFGLVDFGTATDAPFLGSQRATAAERRAYERSWDRIEAALVRAEGQDVAASTVIPAGLQYSAAVQGWIGPMDHGVDFADLSTADFNVYAELESDYLVREGLGSLVALLGMGLPIQLSTAATHIDWSGAGVRVETTAGTIVARACIVTVSTGVLASGTIRFSPDLPVDRQEALADVPMGLLEKVGLMFDGTRFGLPETGLLTQLHESPVPASACHFLTFPTGHDYVVGFVGGSFGWELAAVGAEAAIDFALAEFVRAVGSDARRHFRGGHFSDWARNPLTIGAYSAARPGRHASRATLGQPLGDRVFFAGEAVAGDHIALMSGAHLSGERVAGDVISVLEGGSACGSCDARHQRLRQLKGEDAP